MTTTATSPTTSQTRFWFSLISVLILILLTLTIGFGVLAARLNRTRVVATRTAALTHAKAILNSAALFASDHGDQLPTHPDELLTAIPPPAIWGSSLVWMQDPRLRSPPVSLPPPPGVNVRKYIEDHFEFYFPAAGQRFHADKQQAFTRIILYDSAPEPECRVVAFADGHVESIPEGPKLDALIEENRKNGHNLPKNLRGPPPPP